MIWVTHDLKPHDLGAPGGEVEMVRMLCFEFPDGSGGSEWPVDPDWRPPTAETQTTETSSSGFPTPLVVVGLTATVLVTVSSVAFAGRDRRPGTDGRDSPKEVFVASLSPLPRQAGRAARRVDQSGPVRFSRGHRCGASSLRDSFTKGHQCTVCLRIEPRWPGGC